MNFAEIRRLLDSKKPLDPKKLMLPPRPIVLDIRVLPNQDPITHEELLEVYVVIDESTTRADRPPENRQAIYQAIRTALLEVGIEWFPLLHLVKESDLKEIGLEI